MCSFLGITEPDPPLFTRRIDTFCAGLYQDGAHRLFLFLIFAEHRDNGPYFSMQPRS